MPLRRAQIAPALLLLSAAAGIAAAFVPWLKIDVYLNTRGDDIFRWQSSTPISPVPWLFHGQDIPFVWETPPRPLIMALLLFGPPALAILLALFALLAPRLRVNGAWPWLARACFILGLIGLTAVAYMMVILTDPIHFHEGGVLEDDRNTAQPGLALALAAGIGTIAAGIVLRLSRRTPRENEAALPV